MSENPIWGVLAIVAFSLIGFAMIAGPPWMSAKLGERRRRMIENYFLLPAVNLFGAWDAISSFLQGDQKRGMLGIAAALLYSAYLIKGRLGGPNKSETPGTGASE